MEPELCVCVGQVPLLICSKLYCFCSFNFNGGLLISLKKINCKEAYKREKQAKDFI